MGVVQKLGLVKTGEADRCVPVRVPACARVCEVLGVMLTVACVCACAVDLTLHTSIWTHPHRPLTDVRIFKATPLTQAPEAL